MSKKQKIKNMNAGDFVTKGMKIYGKEVIEQRALPDFRDGLKPVQRRILWSMFDLGMYPNKSWNKAARTVGDVLGKYHPHGDQGAFGAMVTMVNSRYPLVAGEGNWGTQPKPSSDNAAMRYVEAKLSKLGMKIFDCSVIFDMVDNYDATKVEPLILAPRLPVLLLNGTYGIAVGVTSSIPPHNLKEIVNATKYVIKNKKPTVKGILKYIQGPDYVFGGVLLSSEQEVEDVYKVGDGSLDFRCEYHFEKKKELKILVIDSYAPGFNPKSFLNYCKEEFVDEDLLEYARDESGGEEIRVCVGFKNNLLINESILPELEKRVNYKFNYTKRLEKDVEFGSANILTFLEYWVEYLREVETYFIDYKIDILEERLLRAEAILIVIQNLDKFFNILKTSKALVKSLKSKLKLDKEQAEYVLIVASGRFAKLNQKDQQSQVTDFKTQIKALKKKLKNIDQVMLDSLNEFKPFFDDRRTLVREKMSSLKLDDIYVVGRKKGNLDVVIDLDKGRVWKWDYAVNAKQGFITVTEQGLACQWTHDEIDKKDIPYPDLAGIIPGDSEYIILVDDKGKGICVEVPDLEEFMVMKTDGKVTQAVGLKKGESLLVYNDMADKTVKYNFEDINLTRRNAKGWNMIPNRRKPLSIEVMNKNKIIIDADNGSEAKVSDFLSDPSEYWIIGKLNLIIMGRNKKLCNTDESIKIIKKKEIDEIIILD